MITKQMGSSNPLLPRSADLKKIVGGSEAPCEDSKPQPFCVESLPVRKALSQEHILYEKVAKSEKISFSKFINIITYLFSP